MKTRFIIDVATGVVTQTIGGQAVPTSRVGILTAGDKLDCEVQFMAGGTDVTTQVLPEGYTLRLGIRQYPSEDPLLAVSDPQTMVDGIANCTWDLFTSEIETMMAPLPPKAQGVKVWFEAEVSNADGTYRQTFGQQQFTLNCEVNEEGDQPPTAAEVSAGISEDWATKTTGLVQATDYSSKEYAIGVQAGTGGSSKNWAQQTGADVTGAAAGSRSAKSWAQENLTGATYGGSAKDWAQSAALPDGVSKSAKSYAADAASSASAAASSQTAAAMSASNASTSATAAATSATSASNSATAAANSATNAANAVASGYLGQVAGNAVPATASAPGKYWVISSPGTSQGKTWNYGDWAVYGGTSGVWNQLQAGLVDYTSVAFATNSRAPAQGLAFDGTNPATITLPAVGLNDFAVFAWVKPNSFATDQGILSSNSNHTPSIFITSSTGRVALSDQNTGDLGYSTGSLTAGEWNFIGIVRSGTTVTFYINGQTSGTITDSVNHTGTWQYIGARYAGIQQFTGAISRVYPYNRALSSTEVKTLYDSGVPAGSDFWVDGAKNNQNTSAWNNNGFTTLTGNTSTGFTVTNTGTSYAEVGSRPTFTIRPGQSVRVTFNATLTSGAAPSVTFAQQGIGVFGNIGTVSAGANSMILTCPATAGTKSGACIIFFETGASSFSISNVEIDTLGLLLASSPHQHGAGLKGYDTSGNGADITLPSTGVTWLLPASGTIPLATAGSANVVTLAADSGGNYTAQAANSGASLVLGQGANGGFTFTAKGTGGFTFNGGTGWATLSTVPSAATVSSVYSATPFGTVSTTNPIWYIGHRFSAQGPLSIWKYDGTSQVANFWAMDTSGNVTQAGTLTVNAGNVSVQATAANASLVLNQIGTASWSLTNKVTSGTFAIQQGGNDWMTIVPATGATTIAGALTVSGTGVSSFAGQVTAKGTATNDNAAAGNVGEFISATLGSGSAIALTSGVTANVTSITLTAGDWDVSGQVRFHVTATTTVGYFAGASSLVSSTVDVSEATSQHMFPSPKAAINTTTDESLALPIRRLSLSSTTTVYLVATAEFGVSTCSAYGTISARRRR